MGLKKTRLILVEDFLVLLLGLGDPGSRWMFSDPGFTVPSSIGKMIFLNIHGRQHFLCIESLCMDFRCVHLFQFLNVRDQDVSFPDSPRV